MPQLRANVDRDKAKAQGVALTDLFETMQVYLGSLYVNDFNRFGRTYQVIAQADASFRVEPDDIAAAARCATRDGEMVPLGAFVDVEQTLGPELVQPLQRLSDGRDQRRPGARVLLGPGARR